MDFIRKAADTVLRVTPAEAAVRDATNTEKWGPTSTQMHEIAAMTHNYHDYPIVMTTLFKRFQETGRNWRCVYKALLLLEHLIKNGAENCIREAQSRTYELNSLTHFSYIDEDGKDCGLNVLERTKRILELLNDRAAIEDELEKHMKIVVNMLDKKEVDMDLVAAMIETMETVDSEIRVMIGVLMISKEEKEKQEKEKQEKEKNVKEKNVKEKKKENVKSSNAVKEKKQRERLKKLKNSIFLAI